MNSIDFKKISVKSKICTKKELNDLLLCLTDVYHNTIDDNDILPDEYFDELVDIYEKRFGSWKQIGASVHDKTAIPLPFYLGSMDKIKGSLPKEADTFLKSWKKTHTSEAIIQDKLDGVSALLIFKNGKIQMFTRGDGNNGVDISHLLNYIKIPKIKDDIAIRGELIMKDSVFMKNYSQTFKNARNLVSGVVNSKKINIKIAKDIELVSYELIEPSGFSIEEQFSILENYGLKIPNLCSIPNKDVTVDNLTLLLQKYKNESSFYIDGIIIYDNSKNIIRNTSGNPKYAFAFKNINEIAIAKITEVIWNTSKYGVLVPKIKIEPINLSGVTITYATAFDAKYITKNNIGPGTLVEITRSGDVIPYILKIVKSTTASMPKEKYYWGKSGVNIYLDSSENQENVQISIITNFFTQLKIKGLAQKTIETLYNGKLNTIHKILYATVNDLIQINFGPKQADNIVNSINSGIKKVELSKLMAATTIFGVGLGSKKIKLILDNLGMDILKTNKINKKTEEQIATLSGWSEVSARQFVEKLPEFKKFIENNPKISFNITKISTKGKFANQHIVFSGFRDPKLEKEIVTQGGSVKTSVSKNTTLLVTNNISQTSNKIKEALALGIKIISKDEFQNLI